MEKQLLFLLDWDLRINEEDLYAHLEPFLTPIMEAHNRTVELALQAREREVVVEQSRREWLTSKTRAYSPSVAYHSPYTGMTPPPNHMHDSPMSSASSGRSSSRSSDRSEHYYPHHTRSQRHAAHRRSTVTVEYGYDTPPSAPSTGCIPALSRSGSASSAASSLESSPMLPPVQSSVRHLLPILDSGKKRLKTSGGSTGGLLSRLLAGTHHSHHHSPEKLGAMPNRSVY